MRLSSVLSEYNNNQPVQVESIIDREIYTDSEEDLTEGMTLLSFGDFIAINIGKIVLPFFCTTCNDNITYTSSRNIHCLVVNKQLISIDCFLDCLDTNSCKNCSSSIQAWFLVDVDDIFSNTPNVRILKRNFKLPENIKLPYENKDIFSEWFAKAEVAYKERLGAGSIIYLRAIFEKLTKEIGQKENAGIYTEKGKLKPFEQILTAVDRKCSIIPEEFAANGYKLFRKLSEIAHGNSDEKIALKQYKPLRRLVLGVVENVKNKENEIKNNKEITEALIKIGMDNGGNNE